MSMVDRTGNKREGNGSSFHDALALNWPEPREQLHFGGWRATYNTVRMLGLDTADCLLDLCCGEGGTACWLAKVYQRRVVGIDIAKGAITVARQQARQERVQGLAHFVTADIFQLPFPDATFEVIYGQDPDGLAHRNRLKAFRECKRVLRPWGRIGFQHWLPHEDVPKEDLEYFERGTVKLAGWMGRLSVTHYVQDMKAAGFEEIVVEDLSEMYQEHMESVERIADERGDGLGMAGSLGLWFKMALEFIRRGNKLGVRITARGE